MRVLVVNSDYASFVADLYREDPGLAQRSSDEQRQRRFSTLFGLADFYSQALRELGHEAQDVILNLAPAQRKWAGERGVPVREGKSLRLHASPWGFPVPLYRPDPGWMFDVLEAQVREYRPDVFYCMCVEEIGTGFLRRIRPFIRLAVGQHAAPHGRLDLAGYDLLLSSLPNYVAHYRARGLRSELFRLGFSRRVLDSLEPGTKRHEVVFVGGLAGPHEGRTRDLERLCEKLPVKVWGYGVERLRRASPIRAVFQGPLWGRAMYQVLADARVVFNQHVPAVAGPYANNMRLYEATGVGSLLLTDWKENLRDMFDPGNEVATYSGIEECLERAGHYLAHEQERESIARRGQLRTLREHEYLQRMAELVALLEPLLGEQRRRA